MVEPCNPEMSIRRQCELLGLPRSSYYRPAMMENEENLKLMIIIDEQYTKHPWYGSRTMVHYLSRTGYKVNRKRVKRLMMLMGLVSIAPRKRTTIAAKAHKVYPYLLRSLEINGPNQVWWILRIFA